MILKKMTKSPGRVCFHRPADNANPPLACSFGSGQYPLGRTPSAGPCAVGGTNTSGSGGWLSLLDCQQLSSHITLEVFFFFQLKTRRCLTAQQMWSSHAGPSLPALGPRACLLSPVETQMGTPQPHELPRVEGIQLGGMQSGGTERGKGPRHSTGRESDPEAAPRDVAQPREQLAATAPS